jgi:hypothetical protein
MKFGLHSAIVGMALLGLCSATSFSKDLEQELLDL